MKITAISDTHGLDLVMPVAEVMIHAGDMTMYGTWTETAGAGIMDSLKISTNTIIPMRNRVKQTHFILV